MKSADGLEGVCPTTARGFIALDCGANAWLVDTHEARIKKDKNDLKAMVDKGTTTGCRDRKTKKGACLSPSTQMRFHV